MSYKISMKNGINCTEAQWIKSNNLVDTSVKLAGEEAKDRLYEPKHKKKVVRVLTVIAYVFFVSLAAIMLSLYYVFLWNGGQKTLPKYPIQREAQMKCDIVAEMQQQITNVATNEVFSTPSSTEENTTSPGFGLSFDNDEFEKTSTFMKKIMYKYPYDEND
ncbi:uncharacterized protein inaF-D isoform X1 [Tribolium castaneum]|uniref:Transmembrane protein INAFM2 n=1 Tax=Tribolium castaneum TaxID=7070 RepID=D6WSQ1_TRICA|nr:PREDICTED: uncharacterized protein LOC103313833 isoform X1 [Tribolium castaneum]EFA07142.2 hypothetical protein TcasGA2_TC010133 [Tribolium castaneum]|eukprot:XP_008196322.1 PREDICTED: uncharacterized protein LOC103313833 isoform X1 [Tribolium castaneum]